MKRIAGNLLLLCALAASVDEADVQRGAEYTDIVIRKDSDPRAVASSACRDSVFESCESLVLSAIQLEKNRLFGHLLVNWSRSDICGCYMPPRDKKAALQFLHIPKTGTSFNYLLHDYFDCLVMENNTDGCSEWLDVPSRQQRGLCGGRLYSCQGHRTHRDLPQRVFRSGNTNLVTMMREPWQRAMSDYSYILIKPGTQHLSPEQNLTQIFPTDVFTFAMSPGIPNCATKMLNGFQCGETVDLTDYHIDVAKQVLSKILFVGITENFKESVCLFSWLYGGEASPLHMQKTRQTPHLGSRSMQDVLSPQQRILFNAAYKYDIELYRFARELFMNRYHLTGCAISES